MAGTAVSGAGERAERARKLWNGRSGERKCGEVWSGRHGEREKCRPGAGGWERNAVSGSCGDGGVVCPMEREWCHTSREGCTTIELALPQ
jgi:hypothetical protein